MSVMLSLFKIRVFTFFTAQEGHNSPGQPYPTAHNSQQPVVRPVTSLGLQSHRNTTTSNGTNPPRRSWEEKARVHHDSLPQDEQYHREYEPSERMSIFFNSGFCDLKEESRQCGFRSAQNSPSVILSHTK
jgi:hypothetical protein